MSKVWFKPKRFGYGATPASWEGWLATALFCAALPADLVLARRLFADPAAGRTAGLIGAAVLFDPRRMAYLRSPALWASVAAGAILPLAYSRQPIRPSPARPSHCPNCSAAGSASRRRARITRAAAAAIAEAAWSCLRPMDA